MYYIIIVTIVIVMLLNLKYVDGMLKIQSILSNDLYVHLYHKVNKRNVSVI